MKRFFGPGLVLFWMSPIVGEMLSGSSPPASFFTFFGLTCMSILYGGGAILVRETAFRWGKGWPTILVLGAAYGILEEGLLCKSFFNPYWPDAGILGSYGRWLGTNWVWTVELTVYHAVISIAIPILLVGLLFPARRNESWVGRRTQIVLFVLLMLDSLFGFTFFGGWPAWWREAAPDFAAQAAVPILVAPTAAVPLPVLGFDHSYFPAVGLCLGAVAAIVGLVLLAKRLPRGAGAPPDVPVTGARPIWFFAMGFAGIFAFFFISWAVPSIPVAGLRARPIVPILATAALLALWTWKLRRMARGGAGWSDGRALALAAGALTLFILLTPVHEFFSVVPGKNMHGMLFVGVAWVVFLFVLRGAIRGGGGPVTK